MKIRNGILAGILALLMTAGGRADEAAFDTLIRGGRVVDGTGNPWFLADIGIRGGRIAAVGDLTGRSATTTIDAAGRVVAPGFIDVHTHADEDLFEMPEAENFVRDGVTTIVTGNCGGSVVDVADYFARLEADGVGLNVATLYGHNTVLRQTKGSVARELTAEEWEEARSLIDKAMRDGAVGLSTGLIYKPGSFSTTEEVVEMQRVAARHGGMYVTHMRSESLGIINAIEEALRIGRESGSRVQISHMKLPTDMAELLGGAEPILDMVRDARRAGHEVWVDQYPYTASSTGISVMLPDWIFADGPAKAREILQDPEQLPRVLESMRSDHEGDRGRESLEYAVVAWSAGFPQYAGMSIKRVAQVMKLQAEKGPDFDWMSVPVSQLPDVTMEDQYRAVIAIHLGGGAGGVYHTMAESEVETIMQADFVAICSDSGVRRFGSGHPHPRGYGSNARVLGQYVRERRILRLEDAIRKMTSLPATAFRMQDRGMIREGFWADIVVFDEATVGDKATFEEPHQYAQGFDHVLVNGEPVIAGAAMTGRLPGSVIRGPGWHAKN